MKIKIDTDNKTITIEEPTNMGSLFDTLETLLPHGLWREFKLETNMINNWMNPIVIKEYPVYPSSPNPFPFQPYTPIQPYPHPNPIFPNSPYPWITCGTTTDSKMDFTCGLAPGVFNVEYPQK